MLHNEWLLRDGVPDMSGSRSSDGSILLPIEALLFLLFAIVIVANFNKIHNIHSQGTPLLFVPASPRIRFSAVVRANMPFYTIIKSLFNIWPGPRICLSSLYLSFVQTPSHAGGRRFGVVFFIFFAIYSWWVKWRNFQLKWNNTRTHTRADLALLSIVHFQLAYRGRWRWQTHRQSLNPSEFRSIAWITEWSGGRGTDGGGVWW